ncbi:MAG: class E sortase [Thermoleophilaceae bacterium]|nr:class E sortase [Thermoleophilaceae bacterium]
MSANGRPSRSPVRAVLRFVASVMVVSGLLLIADAGVTLAWQEPVSAFLAEKEQAELRRSLDHPPPRVIARNPLPGDAIGEIDIPAIDKSAYIVEGTKTEDLRRGPGHYQDTPMPGDRGTVAIAGHRTTHGAPFREVDQLERGDPIELKMPYGTFVYRVERTRIVEPTALWVKDRVAHDRLILTACHPLYSAAQRIVVFARFARRSAATVSGD